MKTNNHITIDTKKNTMLVQNPVLAVFVDGKTGALGCGIVGPDGAIPTIEAIAVALATAIRTASTLIGESPERIAMYAAAMVLEFEDTKLTTIPGGTERRTS